MTEPIRVLVVDDDPLVRRSLKMILSEEYGVAVVGEASDGVEALGMVQTCAPQVVLMDLRMPRGEGIEAIRKVRKGWPQVQVVALSVYEEDEWISRALEAGAIGYVVKTTSRQILVEAIRKACAGEPVLWAGDIGRLLVKYARGEAGGPHGGEMGALSAREREVLRLIVDGLPNREIARRLYISPRTVKAHVFQILRKMGVSSRTQAAIEAIRRGILEG